MKPVPPPGANSNAPDAGLTASVIIPFHRNLDFLERSLAALASRPASVDVMVAADGAPESCEALAHRYGARVVQLATRSGPAAARNRAAESARGEILIFVDADVVVAEGALAAMMARFADDPHIASVFGSYDDDPHAPGFFSQYKNLAHAFVHRAAAGDVPTFWAGFGGIRKSAFRAVGGFDASYTRPCIEDIELGRRLTAHGYRVVIDPRLRACHLKRWTFVSMVQSDVRDRGIPWTRLILQSRDFPSTLNIDRGARVSVALCWMGAVCAALAAVDWRWSMLSGVMFVTALWINRALYGFLAERRGGWFALRGAAVHTLYHLYNGVSFVIGAAGHFAALRRTSATPPRADVNSHHATPGTS